MSGIDPVTLAVLKGRLEQIADEMDATLFRSAFNPIIAEARDACHGLYHAVSGDTLVQGANGLPIVDLAGVLQTTGGDLFDIENYKRCPGSNERPAPDGSNPFTDPDNPAEYGGPVNCDPSIIPPGS